VPVDGWRCPRDSVTTADEALARVAAVLCEWRGRLEDLAERFDRFQMWPNGLPSRSRPIGHDQAAGRGQT